MMVSESWFFNSWGWQELRVVNCHYGALGLQAPLRGSRSKCNLKCATSCATSNEISGVAREQMRVVFSPLSLITAIIS